MTIQIPGFGRNTLGLRLLSVSTLTFVVSASALHLLLSFEQTLYYVLPYFLGVVKENQVGVRSFNIRILVYCDLTQSEFLPCYFVDQHNLASSVEVDTSRRGFQCKTLIACTNWIFNSIFLSLELKLIYNFDLRQCTIVKDEYL